MPKGYFFFDICPLISPPLTCKFITVTIITKFVRLKMNQKQNVIHWFRRDLRLFDNPALSEAASSGPILPVFIFDELQVNCPQGGASRWWQNQSLNSLNNQLNNRLLIFNGDPKEIIPKLAKVSNPKTVYWNRCYEPWRIDRDAKIKEHLKKRITMIDGRLFSHLGDGF